MRGGGAQNGGGIMAAFIILHQAVFLLACVFLNKFAIFPIILQRPAEVTREYIDAYFAAP